MATADNPQTSQADRLDVEHWVALEHAVTNFLSLDVAEDACAQVFDGLLTPDGMCAYGGPPQNRPVYLLQHNQIGSEFLERAREMHDRFTVSDVSLNLGRSKHFKQHTGCHQISAYLFDSDDSKRAHSLQIHRDWPGRCPRGEADIAGFWAEDRIFRGIVLFDRGESEGESTWLHGEHRRPQTLYPPTDAHFKALMAFLLSDPQGPDSERAALKDTCLLPIRRKP